MNTTPIVPKPEQVVRKIFRSESGPSSPKEGLPFVDKKAVVVVLKHWEEDKYLVLENRDSNGKHYEISWITGGREEGETPEENAKREIKEEVGYTDLELIQELRPYDAEFFHQKKQTNIRVYFDTFLYKLNSDTKVEVSKEEQNNHDISWVSLEEATSMLNPEGNRWIAEQIKSKYE